MLKSGFVAAALFGLLVMVANRAQAQQVPPAGDARGSDAFSAE